MPRLTFPLLKGLGPHKGGFFFLQLTFLSPKNLSRVDRTAATLRKDIQSGFLTGAERTFLLLNRAA